MKWLKLLLLILAMFLVAMLLNAAVVQLCIALRPLALLFIPEYLLPKLILPSFFAVAIGLAATAYLLRLISKKYYSGRFKISTPILALVAITLLISLILMAKEYQLFRLDYYPGSQYCGNDFTEAKPKISNRLLADERGMAYYNPDFYAGQKDSTQLIVNHDGFPAPFDFTPGAVDSMTSLQGRKRRKILFLGDSFLEGVGASLHNKSFIEIYKNRNQDQLICPTGIGGMDVVQYRLVAEKYIPLIKPDRVVIMFCGWNDIIWLDRKPRPYMPTHTFIEKVGIIYNYIPASITPYDTLVLSADSAYNLYRRKFSLMGKQNIVQKLAATSRVTTQLYYAANPTKLYPCQFASDSMATYRNIKRIKELCDSAGVQFSIVFIPTPPMQKYTPEDYEKNYRWAFKELWPFVRLCPTGYITESDCSTSADFHFNDTGQKRFADFMQTLDLK